MTLEAMESIVAEWSVWPGDVVVTVGGHVVRVGEKNDEGLTGLRHRPDERVELTEVAWTDVHGYVDRGERPDPEDLVEHYQEVLDVDAGDDDQERETDVELNEVEEQILNSVGDEEEA